MFEPFQKSGKYQELSRPQPSGSRGCAAVRTRGQSARCRSPRSARSAPSTSCCTKTRNLTEFTRFEATQSCTISLKRDTNLTPVRADHELGRHRRLELEAGGAVSPLNVRGPLLAGVQDENFDGLRELSRVPPLHLKLTKVRIYSS